MSLNAWVKIKGKTIRHWGTWTILSNAFRVGKETRGGKGRKTPKSLAMNGKDERHSLTVIFTWEVRRELIVKTWEGIGGLIS